MKIAINELGGSQWTGGVTYRRNLIKALRSHPGKTDIFMISKDGEVTKQFAISENQVIRHTGSASFITKKIDAVARKFFNYDLLMSQSIKGKDIDILFPGHHSVGKGIASIYWMPDFQFMHLPHLFSKSAVDSFNKKLPEYFENASLIVLSSKDAQKDFKTFSPQYLDKTRVMNFVAHVPEGLYDEPSDLVRKTYNLPEDFIYLPNQFWAHKNHVVVLKALKILREQNIKPFIVFTGNPVDVRNPMYLGDILQKINEWGIRDQIAFLGLVPHKFVYSLIRNSKFVLNPSLFEGWSTIVEESKSVGKRLLLSNLGVHIEQDPANSVFFDPHDPEDCAQKMKEMWQAVPEGPDLEMEKTARAALPERMKTFADTFLAICEEAAFPSKIWLSMKDNLPLVSIITPAFNAMPYLKATVESIKMQGYPHLEHIVMDGGSNDGSVAYLKTQSHIDWTSEKDRGQSHAINKAFAKTKGEIIGWLNADDTYEPEAINTVVNYFMEHPEVDFVHSDINIIDEKGEFIGLSKAATMDINDLLFKNDIKQPTLFMRMAVIDKLKGVNEDLHYVMDWELWLRMMINGYKGKYFKGTTFANFRLCEGTKTFEDGPKFLAEWAEVMRRYFKTSYFDKISESVKNKALKSNQSSYEVSLMRKSMEHKNRANMFQHFFKAIRWDSALLLNRGIWKFLAFGIFGISLDQTAKFKKNA